MPKLVTDEYSELMHYTTASGLKGIVSTGCFWATHAAFLNDTEELSHFFDARLLDIAKEAITSLAAQIAPSKQNAEEIARYGGMEKLIESDAIRVTGILRSATLRFHEPYVFSMCASGSDKTSKNGLLSQWRGYGSDGGYAIVLDSHGIDHLLKLEAKKYHYQFAQWGDVYYYGSEPNLQSSTEEVAEYEDIVRQGVIALIRGKNPESVENLYDAITSLSCLYKHWGFIEEREVRVIAIPATGEVSTLAAANGETRTSRLTKNFLRGAMRVPYIELLAELGPNATRTVLPIKSIVVGPHRDKQRRAEEAQDLLESNGYNVQVVVSEIPYIGR